MPRNLPPLHPSHPFLGKGKMEGEYDRCSILQNELIAWQSHREMRLAGEYSMEEAEACKWCWGKASVSVTCRAWCFGLGRGRGAAAPHSAGPLSSVLGTWEPEPQAEEQACAVHRSPSRPDTPMGTCTWPRTGKNTHSHVSTPPAPHDREPVSWGWASRLWELRPCHHVQGLSTDTPFLCLNDRYLSAGPGRPLHLTGVRDISPGCCLPLHGAPLLNPSARGTLGAQEGGTPKPSLTASPQQALWPRGPKSRI